MPDSIDVKLDTDAAYQALQPQKMAFVDRYYPFAADVFLKIAKMVPFIGPKMIKAAREIADNNLDNLVPIIAAKAWAEVKAKLPHLK